MAGRSAGEPRRGPADDFLDAYDRVRLMADAARRELELDDDQPGRGHASRAAAYAALAVYERLEANEMLTDLDGDAFERLRGRVTAEPCGGSGRRPGSVNRVRAVGEWCERWIARRLAGRRHRRGVTRGRMWDRRGD